MIFAAFKFPFVMIYSITLNAWETGSIYAKGLWLLFAHPLKFQKFFREYQRFEQAIDRADGIRNSEYFDLNRATRRRVERAALKAGHI